LHLQGFSRKLLAITRLKILSLLPKAARKNLMKFVLRLATVAITTIILLLFIQPVWAEGIVMTGTYNPVSDSYRWSNYCKILPGDSGIKACNLAITLNPSNPVNWNNRGEKLFNKARYVDALVSYNHALLIDPEYSLVLANRCAVLSELQKYAEALNSCELALSGNKEWGTLGEMLVWNNRGDVLFNLGRYEESLDSFEKALAINPWNESVLQNRATVMRKLGKVIKNDKE
jgi:tetratricopeptide (TPR) repeat protein